MSVLFFDKQVVLNTNQMSKNRQTPLIISRRCLSLVCSWSPSSSCPLKLPSLGSDMRLGMRMRNSRSRAEVFYSLSWVSRSLNQKCILSWRSSSRQFVNRNAFSSCSQDSWSSSLWEPKGTDCHLRQIEFSDVIGDGSDDNDDLIFISFSTGFMLEFSKGNCWPIDPGHKESLQDNFVELGICSSSQESIGFNQQQKVRILRNWSLPSCLSIIFVTDVDSLSN